ncbi:MAG: exodeoxyribonuclease III [Chloroflexota bacterium]
MKIVTWNVNGLRAILKKGFLDWVRAETPDALCLQEIKARPEQIAEEDRIVDGYEALWNPAERPGYSGVATWLRRAARDVEFGLADPRFDPEGRVIRTRHDGFLLYNVYFPNGQRGQERVAYKLDFYARLLEICDRLHAAGENIVITGDFNTAHMPIDLRNPKENVNTSGFMPEERAWVDHFLSHGFVDAYRYLYPERVQYTWWTYRVNARQRDIGWRLDYYLVSEALLPRVKDVVIHTDVMGSDHCPVSLWLE